MPTIFGRELPAEFAASGYNLGLTWDGELIVVYGHDEIVAMYSPVQPTQEAAGIWVRRIIHEDQVKRLAAAVRLAATVGFVGPR